MAYARETLYVFYVHTATLLQVDVTDRRCVGVEEGRLLTSVNMY